MAKICTSIEQSKKLIELGLSRDTADMHYCNGDETDLEIGNIMFDNDIPAWSSTALMNLLPEMNLLKGDITKKYYIEYIHSKTNKYNEPVDALYEFVCHMIERGKIKTEK